MHSPFWCPPSILLDNLADFDKLCFSGFSIEKSNEVKSKDIGGYLFNHLLSSYINGEVWGASHPGGPIIHFYLEIAGSDIAEKF